MKRPLWVDKAFEFELPVDKLPEVIQKLNATSGRLRKILGTTSGPDMEVRIDNKWSIKENVGHLSDLEELHLGRLEDLENGLEVLRPADMTNAVTEATDHNSTSLRDLIHLLEDTRAEFIAKLQSLDERTQNHSALHERLQLKMRPIDVAEFVAAHDDYHIDTIKQILADLEDMD